MRGAPCSLLSARRAERRGEGPVIREGVVVAWAVEKTLPDRTEGEG